MSDAQTAYALALQFGLMEDAEQRAYAGERLARLVSRTGPYSHPAECKAGALQGHAAMPSRYQMTPPWASVLNRGVTSEVHL